MCIHIYNGKPRYQWRNHNLQPCGSLEGPIPWAKTRPNFYLLCCLRALKYIGRATCTMEFRSWFLISNNLSQMCFQLFKISMPCTTCWNRVLVAQQGKGGLHLSCSCREAWLGQLIAAMPRRVLIEAVMCAVHIWKTCAVACRFPACMDETIIELYQCPISEY